MKIKALPKKYRGVWFKSHLEAAHAKWFDSLGIKWVYEAQGYKFSDDIVADLCYLPDFWLPRTKTFFEVKGVLDPNDDPDDLAKILALARHMEPRDIQVVVGMEPVSERFSLVYPTPGGAFGWVETDNKIGDGGQGGSQCLLTRCPDCKQWWFVDCNALYNCRACGAYNGGNISWNLIEGEPVGQWDWPRYAIPETTEGVTPFPPGVVQSEPEFHCELCVGCGGCRTDSCKCDRWGCECVACSDCGALAEWTKPRICSHCASRYPQKDNSNQGTRLSHGSTGHIGVGFAGFMSAIALCDD